MESPRAINTPPTALARRPIVATLDTCVLYPNYLRDFLLSTSFTGRLYAPRWSEEILQELTRNVIEDAGMPPSKAERLIIALRRAFPLAEVPRDGLLLACIGNQIKDRHVVEAALVGRAEVIVTHNLRDFRDAALAPLGLVSQSPDAFLGDVYQGHEHVLPVVLQSQRERYKTHRLSHDDLVEILLKVVPRTMALLSPETNR